jgi:hypothetical protein
MLVRLKKPFKAGSLVKVVQRENWTLIAVSDGGVPPFMREVPLDSLHRYDTPALRGKFKNIEGKVSLIVYVSENRLGQPLGYRVLLDAHEVFCKAIIAHKYFNVVETYKDESR